MNAIKTMMTWVAFYCLWLMVVAKVAQRPKVDKPKVPTGPSATIEDDVYKAHFKKQGGLYELGGFSHVSMDIKLSAYRNAVKTGCAALHKVASQIHKPGLVHLYEAVLAMEERCKKLESAADSQLRAMGTDESWVKYWRSTNVNPFSPVRRPVVPKPEERADPSPPSHGQPTHNGRRSTTEEMEDLVTMAPMPEHDFELDVESILRPVVNYPEFMDAEYQHYCQEQTTAEICCSTALFEHPNATKISGLGGCRWFAFPELMMGSKYYNPLFLTAVDLKTLSDEDDLTHIRRIYQSATTSDAGRDYGRGRSKRFLTALSIAGGYMFGAAIDKVLGLFGYSTTTSADVKHINSNQAHISQVERHVEVAEKFAEQMKEEAHKVEAKEQMIERFLHVSSSLQGIFDHYELMMGAISILFHTRNLSPILVERNAVMREMRALQLREREEGNVLLINVLDVWMSKLSYVVTRQLDIYVMLHLPVGKATSYRQLYEYVPTPLAFTNGSTHFFPNPADRHLLLDRNNDNARIISEVELAECESVKEYIRFCPAQSYQLTMSPPSCLTSLHQGDSLGVLAKCPVTLVEEDYIYIQSLGFGEYSVYSRDPVKARVVCGSSSVNSLEITGLMRLLVRRDCRVIGDMFTIEPVLDFKSGTETFDIIPLEFEEDANYSVAATWGKDKGLLTTSPDVPGQTMMDVAKAWDNTRLEESDHLSFTQQIMAAFATLVSVLALVCVTKEGWGCYRRRVQRKKITTTIAAQVAEQIELRPMLPRRESGVRRESVAPSNPAYPATAPDL